MNTETEKKGLLKKLGGGLKTMKPFPRFLILYGIALLLIVIIGLVVFRGYISAYEHSRPAYAVESYLEKKGLPDVTAAAEEYTAGLTGKLQTDEDINTYLTSVFQDAEAVRAAGSSDASITYMIRNNGTAFARLTLEPGDKGAFGFTPWTVTDSEYNFDSLMIRETLDIPADCSLSFLGTAIGNAFITDTEVPYALLADFYDCPDISGLPYLTRYEVTHTADTTVEVITADGTTYDSTEITETLFTNNCSSDTAAQIETFTREYISRYVTFTSGANYDTSGNYTRLVALVVAGSDLQSRLLQAVPGLGFASSRGDTLLDVTINATMSLDPSLYSDAFTGLYAVDATYQVETIGQNGAVDTTSNARLLLVESYGNLYTLAMQRY